MEGLFAGLDVSTQGCKLVVIDAEAEVTVFVDSVVYDDDLPQYGTRNGVVQGLEEGVSESDPDMWLEAVDMVFDKLRAAGVRPDQIRCISVSGQQHGLVALDAEGNLTRSRSKLWNDFSTSDECEILNEKAGGREAMIHEVGNSQRTGYTAAKILHMFRHERDAYRRSTTFFLVHNYINWYLTGGKNGGVRIMEPGDTSGMALWNPATGSWSDKVLNAIDSGLKAKLPPVRPSDRSVGHISGELVAKYGFRPDCLVGAGSGDNMYGAVGTGNAQPGIVTISLGTSGTAYTFMEQPYIDPSGEIAAFCDSTGHYLPLLCVSNLANGYDTVLKMFDISHEEFGEIISRTAVGNAGRILIPWFTGERTPDIPLASPLYFGFGLEDFTRENLCRAVLEGHILNLFEGFHRMPVDAKEIRLTGGLSQSESWCQTFADIFETEAVPVEGEGAALGAALHAAWVWHKESGRTITLREVVEPFVILNEGRRKQPDRNSLEACRIQKKLFHALSNRIRGIEGEDPYLLRDRLTQFQS
ncbi:xylulokinase [Candidatus Neomarinimicrobiota bacterium]